MDSTRPIRALLRGLDALTVLNLRDGATVSEVAQEIRLPRTTVYRILETLSNAGFIYRDPKDERYRLTILVRGLSAGFADEPWVRQIAQPCLDDLGREINWPICIATASGAKMMVREASTQDAPSAAERYCPGMQLPLLSSAAGRAYLANCAPALRDPLIDILARSSKEEDKLARSRAELLRLLGEIKAQGHAMTARARRLLNEASIAVPVALRDRTPAVLALRFAVPAAASRSSVENLLPKLRQCAARISSKFLEQQAETRNERAPEAAA